MPRKGIVDAPFQLILVGTLLMFVVAIGMKIMTDTQELQCHTELKNEMIKLKNAIERISSAPVGTTDLVKMNFRRCITYRTYDVGLRTMSGAACYDCEGTPFTCTKIIERAKGPGSTIPTIYQSVCINRDIGDIKTGSTFHIVVNDIEIPCKEVLQTGSTPTITYPAIVKIIKENDGILVCPIPQIEVSKASKGENT